MTPAHGSLSVHVHDTIHGCSATGLPFLLFRVDGTERTLLGRGQTDETGACGIPLLDGAALRAGAYEVLLDLAAWDREPRVTDMVPVRMRIDDVAAAHGFSVQLLPNGYTVQRRS